MTRAFKTFLVWLLMALLPLHAVAAGVGMSCLSGHQAVEASPAPQHAGGEEHAHHGHHDAGDASVAGAANAADDGAESGKQAHSSCSACSVFCVGAVAPPSATTPVLPSDGSEAVIVAPAAFAAGFIPDGPQRPPRRSFA